MRNGVRTLLAGWAALAHGQLTLNVYDNTALAGTPVSTTTIATLNFSLPIADPAAPAPLSAEVLGTLSYPSGVAPCFENDRGCFVFRCAFPGASYAFLWVDDHLVCQVRQLARDD